MTAGKTFAEECEALADRALALTERALEHVLGVRPKHRAEPVELFELTVDTVDEQARIEPGLFLIEEKGWPACAFTVHAVGLFAAAVERRYIAVRGYEPPRDRGPVYRGFTDWLIMRDTYDEEMGALVEQLAFEGGQR